MGFPDMTVPFVTMCVLAIMGLVFGTWKMIDIGVWIYQHVNIGIQ